MITVRRAGSAFLVALALVLSIAPQALAAGTVTIQVTGQGTATGPGINCSQAGGDCSEHYNNVTFQECDPACHTVSEAPTETYTAGLDGNGFVFDGWTGCDSVSGRACSLTVDADKSLTARFRDYSVPLVGQPTPSSGTRNGTVTLATSASDNAAIKRVEFYNDTTKLGEDSSAPYELAWDTTTVADGAKSIVAKAIDTSDNLATSSSSTFTVDNTPPGMSVTSGPDGATFGLGTTQSWTFSATDATSAVTSECRIVSPGAAPAFGSCSGGNGAHSVANLPDGIYTFHVRARDAGGLNSATAVRTFTIDGSAPETSITSGPADGSSTTDTTITFGLGASEGGATFVCRVYPAALTPPAFEACSGASSHTGSGFSPGTYSFEVRATDAVGNVDASPAKRTFTVVPPSVVGSAGGENGPAGSAGGPSAPAPVTLAAFAPRLSKGTRVSRTATTFTRLVASGLPAGARVRVACKGRGCAFARRTLAVKGASLDVLSALKRLRLGPGAVLTVTVVAADGRTRTTTYTMRRGRGPSVKTA